MMKKLIAPVVIAGALLGGAAVAGAATASPSTPASTAAATPACESRRQTAPAEPGFVPTARRSAATESPSAPRRSG